MGKFEWNPVSYDVAKQHVDMARERAGIVGEQLARVMPGAIQTMGGINGLGGLTCPAPTTDPGGTYRVGLDSRGQLEIQRLDGEAWVPAE